MMRNIKKFISLKIPLIAFLLILSSCKEEQAVKNNLEINLDHLNSLYEEILMDRDTVGIIHIYCEYPDYKWVDDSDEGTACVDDVARAAIVYMNYYKLTGDRKTLDKSKKLLNFVMKMQAGNGWFYNFIFPDYSVNTTHKNSIAEPGWWTWRAVWSLLEGYKTFVNVDKNYADNIKSFLDRVVSLMKSYLPEEERMKSVEGIDVPTWLPYESASDQAALINICLVEYSRLFNDRSVEPVIHRIARGIKSMQCGDEEEFPYGAILCFDNLWHGWGSIQSYSLLLTGNYLRDHSYSNTALLEIDSFYPYLLNEKFLQEFTITKSDSGYRSIYEKEYPQIAYQLRCMMFATVTAYQLTGKQKYMDLSERILKWFSGKNPANIAMYDSETGRCYDGIQNINNVNKNSGAESTIEALLSIIQFEMIRESYQY